MLSTIDQASEHHVSEMGLGRLRHFYPLRQGNVGIAKFPTSLARLAPIEGSSATAQMSYGRPAYTTALARFSPL